MIKRTLYFGNPAYLSMRNSQLVVRLPEVEKNGTLCEIVKKEAVRTIPIEDIGMVVLDNKQITITQGLLEMLIENNCALLSCDSSRLPVGLFLPLCGHSLQSERFRKQINMSQPLRKQLWQQTVQAKIANQAAVLKKLLRMKTGNMDAWVNEVKSDDADNLEARAAAFYWKNAFPSIPGFVRDREGESPNAILNYGYAILRALVARSLVCCGLLPTFGIHHRSKYNAYCLADDIMEPYRPVVDEIVVRLVANGDHAGGLTQDIKAELLSIPTKEVKIENRRSPLMVAVSTTSTSLYKCIAGESRKIIYPSL